MSYLDCKQTLKVTYQENPCIQEKQQLSYIRLKTWKLDSSYTQVAMSMMGPVVAFYEEKPSSCRQTTHSCILRFCDMISNRLFL